MNAYLLSVVESGSDFRKAGAVNARYWAEEPLAFVGTVPPFTIEYATPESRAAYEALSDLRERKRRLLLENVRDQSESGSPPEHYPVHELGPIGVS